MKLHFMLVIYIYISLNSRLSIAAWDVIKNTCTKVRIHVQNNVD